MKKLTLDLEALRVDSFETLVITRQRGTVRANAASDFIDGWHTFHELDHLTTPTNLGTCVENSCGGTCDHECAHIPAG